MKQVRCPNCSRWSEDEHVCEHCGEVLSEEKKTIILKEKEGKIKKPEPSGKLQAFFEYTRTSKNPLLRFIYFIAISLWGIYVGLVILVMYMVVAASG